MNKFEVLFYETLEGEKPIEVFLDSLDTKMRAKILGLLEILEEKGNSLREPYSNPLGDDIFELRCQMVRNITRVLYFFYYNRQIILTNGFVKKTRKTPKEVIILAKKRRLDFLERMKKNEKLKSI